MKRCRINSGVTIATALGLVAAFGAQAGAATPTVSVSVTNSGYTPSTVSLPMGGKVVWSFKQGTHTVTDSSRMHLFDSGTKTAGTQFSFTFIDAGTYAYHSTTDTGMNGKVLVPMKVAPSTGTRTTYFAVTWGSDWAPSGYNEQVQMKVPGSTKWEIFVYGTTTKDAAMRPADWGNKTGVYQFRAKLYKGLHPGVSSGWSPVAKITVH